MKFKKIPIYWRNLKYGILKLKPSSKIPQNYWKHPEDFGNTPEGHSGKHLDDLNHAKYMHKIIKKLVEEDKSIFEVGCNCGKNINYLREKGYKKLGGIDINQNAIELMKRLFPKLYYNSKIHVKEVEEGLKHIEDESYDVVFSLTVLMHIHSDSEFIFKEMVRITDKYLITLEDESMGKAWSHYPRNYKKIFEKLGLKQIKEEKCDHILANHTLRVFKK